MIPQKRLQTEELTDKRAKNTDKSAIDKKVQNTTVTTNYAMFTSGKCYQYVALETLFL